MIKCPACWQEIDDNESVCPKCGFVLRAGASNDVEIEIHNDSWNGNQSYYPQQNNYQKLNSDYSTIKKSNNMKSKDKAIISAAIVAIVVIVFVFAIPKGNSKSKKDYYDSYSYGNDYSYDYSYSSGVKTGKEGALNKAKSYLNTSAFSYTGLIEQLEYEGFSNSEATYGADNCGANWKDQALKKAKSYLNTSAFSESGLQEQLEYEGFTTEEAKYGVSNCGADWKQQASKKAASYLRSHSGWSRSELIDQLEYEGFTYDQASYGALQNGL